ncbi:hypothetical protein LTS10_013262 [Elasticomyces elasticus]|nr:hypothetical protein LTS10_013262 [Elasticomyces elasticus]
MTSGTESPEKPTPPAPAPAAPCDWDRVLRFSPVPTLILDDDFKIVQVSQSYLDLAHRALGNMVGWNTYDFVDEKVPVPDSETVRKAVDKAMETRKVYVLANIPGGNMTFWTIRVIPIIDGDKVLNLIFEVEETTEIHAKNQLLAEQFNTNETYRMLVETVKDYAIFMLDTRGCVATWNLGAQLLKGYSREEITGCHFSNFYGLEDRIADKPGRELEWAIRDGKLEDEGWRYRKDGSRFWANVIITPVYRNGILIGFSKVTRDLTERKATEARLISAYEESAKLKSEFLANMSHEIRTPMHGMLSALTLLTDTGLNPEQTELASIIVESGGVLLQVINDILDYSKLASGCFSISSDVINVPDIILSVVRGSRATLVRDVSLITVVSPLVPELAEGDPLRYRQTIQNLVGNAVKFTESGHIRVRATLTHEDMNHYTVLTEVTDTGIGVPDYAIGSLFSPFTQFDNSATKRYKGTGLGLSICKSLAELMGGAIGFRPNPDGQGSVFWFTAKLRKLKQLEQLDDIDAKLKTVQISPPSLDQFKEVKRLAQHRRLLLAEDNDINQKVMVRMLKNLGFDHIDTASDGAQVLALARQHGHAYDLILMDINMPVMDGVAATQAIRENGLQTPIIAMTANALKGHLEAFLAKGLNDYIPKPVDRKLLLTVLLKWLQFEGDRPPSTNG